MQASSPRPRRGRAVTAAAIASGVAFGLASAPAPAPADPHSTPSPTAHTRHTAGGNAVVAWNEHAGDAALAACLAPGNHPPFEARMYAMTQLAVHDALNAIRPTSQPYAFHGHAAAGSSPDAAVAAAARYTLRAVIADLPPELGAACVTDGQASVQASYTASLGAIPDGRAKTRGMAVGRRAAAAVLAVRAHDGSDTPMVVADYPQGTEPGQRRFTPGADVAFVPGWSGVDAFALRSNDQFPSAPPYSLTSAAYSAATGSRPRVA